MYLKKMFSCNIPNAPPSQTQVYFPCYLKAFSAGSTCSGVKHKEAINTRAETFCSSLREIARGDTGSFHLRNRGRVTNTSVGTRTRGSEHFKARHLFTARMVQQGRATAFLRHDNSRGTLGKMIQSVRLQRQHALFLPLRRLFVFVWRFARPVSVPRCFSTLPHKFGPAAVAVELLKLTAAPLFLTACSFIIVSSSGPLGLMFSNEPLYLETFWVEAFAIYSLSSKPKRRPAAPWSTKTDQIGT